MVKLPVFSLKTDLATITTNGRRLLRGILLLAITGVLLVGMQSCAHTGKLARFSTDGCSSFPDGPPGEPDKWRNCCVLHDQAYWLGGTYTRRVAADKDLRVCISQVENPVLADTMWAGVRVGGSPFWPTRFRWAYGWPYTRGYRALTAAERILAQTLSTAKAPTD